MASYCKEVKETLLHVVCMSLFIYNRLCNITRLSVVYCVTIIHNLTMIMAYT